MAIFRHVFVYFVEEHESTYFMAELNFNSYLYVSGKKKVGYDYHLSHVTFPGSNAFQFC